jgi:hypothetical protein
MKELKNLKHIRTSSIISIPFWLSLFVYNIYIQNDKFVIYLLFFVSSIVSFVISHKKIIRYSRRKHKNY